MNPLLQKKKLTRKSTISLTSDGWKNSSSTNYLGITSRIVTEDFNIYNVWENLKLINESTADNIIIQINQFAEEYEINNLESITTDGAPNITRAAREY